MKLSMRHLRVLKALDNAGVPLATRMLPNGHGHSHGYSYVSPRTLGELDRGGLIAGAPSDFGWRWSLTDAGRAALKEDRP